MWERALLASNSAIKWLIPCGRPGCRGGWGFNPSGIGL